MSELLIAQYIKAQIALDELKNRLTDEDRGADTLEWVGMMILAAVIIMALYGVVTGGGPFIEIFNKAVDAVKTINP